MAALGYQAEDTIFALSTGIERAAIAVLRVSGAGSRDILLQVCGKVPDARKAVLRKINAPHIGLAVAKESLVNLGDVVRSS